MSDMDIYTSIAANLEESGWSSVLSQLDTETFEKLTLALDSVKDVAEAKEEGIPDDPAQAVTYLSGRFDKVVKGIKAHRKRLETIDMRLAALEAGGGGGGGAGGGGRATASRGGTRGGGGAGGRATSGKRPKRKLKNQAALATDSDEKEPSSTVDDSRKHFYRFGSRNLQVVKPLDGYPNRSDARSEPVRGDLNLEFVHGYNGQSDDARQNICLTPDGRYVIYFIAAVGIVYDIEAKTQKFFTRHNDDVTTCCLDPRPNSTLVATGQKDPKDTPGQGKDLPKVWIWDYAADNPSKKPVKLLENICWGKVARVQWSQTGYLYVIGGDEDQTLKIFNSDRFSVRGPCEEEYKCPTTREQILGFIINPAGSGQYFDEFVVYGKRKFYFAGVKQEADGWKFKARAVSVTPMKKDGEKAFTCAQFLPNGTYVVGAASGAMYVCREENALACVGSGHDKAVGALALDVNGLLISAGNDGQIKKWTVNEVPAAAAPAGGRKKRGGPRPPAPLTQEWTSGEISIPGSDFHSFPRCMVYDEKEDLVYLGSKTNQMMRYEFKSQEPTLVVDGHDGSIWGLATSPVDPALFVTGGYDNAIKLWDANDRRCIDTLEFELEEGDKTGNQVSCAAWSADGRYIAIGSEQSNVIVCGINPLRVLCFQNIPPKTANAAVEKVAYLRFSADSQYLAAAHMDSQTYIYTIAEAEEGVILEQWPPLKYVAAPTNLQWSEPTEDGKYAYVKCLTRDYEVVHHKLSLAKKRSKFSPSIPLPEEVMWAEDPLIAGWDVEGLYQAGWDGTDLNDATVTSDGLLVVSGDDYGTIRLHNYPAIAPEACKPYTGHAEFVVGVEWLRDDSQLITCGGDDKAIMQWRLTRPE